MHATLQYVCWLYEYIERIRGNWSRHNPALIRRQVAVQVPRILTLIWNGPFPTITMFCYGTQMAEPKLQYAETCKAEVNRLFTKTHIAM